MAILLTHVQIDTCTVPDVSPMCNVYTWGVNYSLYDNGQNKRVHNYGRPGD